MKLAGVTLVVLLAASGAGAQSYDHLACSKVNVTQQCRP